MLFEQVYEFWIVDGHEDELHVLQVVLGPTPLLAVDLSSKSPGADFRMKTRGNDPDPATGRRKLRRSD